jgi:hypothetical protein
MSIEMFPSHSPVRLAAAKAAAARFRATAGDGTVRLQ